MDRRTNRILFPNNRWAISLSAPPVSSVSVSSSYPVYVQYTLRPLDTISIISMPHRSTYDRDIRIANRYHSNTKKIRDCISSTDPDTNRLPASNNRSIIWPASVVVERVVSMVVSFFACPYNGTIRDDSRIDRITDSSCPVRRRDLCRRNAFHDRDRRRTRNRSNCICLSDWRNNRLLCGGIGSRWLAI